VQIHDIKIGNRCFENVAQFRYLGMTITDQEEIKRRLKCLLPFSPLSSHLLSKNIQIGIYKTIILPVVLYRWQTWSLTLKEEHRLGVLRRIF
jgi:hypothetical protein